MNVLVLNCGSSSVKYQLIDVKMESILAQGIVGRIGIKGSFLEHKSHKKEELTIKEEIPDHSKGIELVVDALLDDEYGVITDINEIDAVGHRIAHGGESFTDSTLITDEVYQEIENNKELAPLHNPPNLLGIDVSQELIPDAPDVGVFDTAFHQSMPAKSYIYGLPYKFYEQHGVRRYGFHGTSHKYVSHRAAEMVNKSFNQLKIISCHLGNGASVAAINKGEVVDTSMGLTPLEGLVMGTRCGDIDPGIIPFIMKKEDLTPDELEDILNNDSGVAGISGISSDFRDLEKAASDGNKRAELAIEVFCHKVKKYIGAYSAVLEGVDIVVFTAGIGENSVEVRERILSGLEYLGIKLDRNKNHIRGKAGRITTENSETTALVIPTNEELVIARETKKIVKKL